MGKFGSVICAIVKDEERYIAEWIAYHHVIGFEKIFLYDNGSTDGTRDIVRQWADFVTLIDWPTRAGMWMQHAAYRDFMVRFSSLAEWVVFLDADEFLNLKQDDKVSDFLVRCGEVAAIGMNWRMFGDGGEVIYRDGLVMERFTKAACESFGGNHIIKTIARCDAIEKPDIHTSALKVGCKLVSPSGRLLKQHPAVRQDIVEVDRVQVNHYFVKSYAEWQIKRDRGKADFPAGSPSHMRTDGEFAANNRNDVAETSIQRFMVAVRRQLQNVGG